MLQIYKFIVDKKTKGRSFMLFFCLMLATTVSLAQNGAKVTIKKNSISVIEALKAVSYTHLWPTTWFVPRLCEKPAFKDVYSVMNNWGANHGAISYGHIGQDLITLASMLRIPVCMHNVEDNEIFRPAAWNAFGMDKEGADYRACTTYGPIYK